MSDIDVASKKDKKKACEVAVKKVTGIFDEIQGVVMVFGPLVLTASKLCLAVPRYKKDMENIATAFELFKDMLVVESMEMIKNIQQGTLTDEQVKIMRHDLRAKVGTMLGYSELILEELAEESGEGNEEFIHLLKEVIAQIKVILPYIDSLRVDEVLDTYEEQSHVNDECFTLSDPSLPYGEQFAHCTVLIIDDSIYNREILSRRLMRYGVKVLTAEDGAIGLKMVKGSPVDLILLDILMPVMDGYEVLSNLKKSKDTIDIPVLMISALSEVDSIVRCIEAGAEDYLPTPFNPVVLHARIKSCLEKRILRDRENENVAKLVFERQRMEMAIESIDDGFAVFDANLNLSMCNQRFQILYPGVVKLGMHGFSYKEFLRANLELGVFFEERRDVKENSREAIENWMRTIDARQKAGESYLLRLKGNRWIEVANSFTPDGGQVTVHKDVTNRREDEDRLTYQATHDSLTGLANRVAFEVMLMEALKVAKSTSSHFAVLFIDLDGFKQINDTLGHDVGDLVLGYVGAALKKSVRDHDLVARFGGDEFAVLFNPVSTQEDLSTISERILANIGSSYRYEGKDNPFGVSIGIARFPHDAMTLEDLIARSDEAMYFVKKTGKGHFAFYSEIQDNAAPVKDKPKNKKSS